LVNKENKYVWKRLSDVYQPGELNILKEPPNMKDDPDVLCEDPVQGELGDCYFLSAISALAEFPKRLKQLIPNNSFTPSGVFEAVVFLHGEPTRVVIDDYFPFIENGEGERPDVAFVRFNPLTKNIWPLIIEKVWAKVNLSYEDIIAGNSSEAFEFLAPAPIDTYYHDVHKDTLFEEIQDADSKDYIICSDITVTENTNVNYLAKMGLITNHAYTVIDTAVVSEPKGNIVKLLKIRNPWGTNEWLGDWSDKSNKWTPEIKEMLKYENAEDGTYWMAFDDFTKFYTSTHICKIKDDYNFISNKYDVDHTKQFNLVSVVVPKDSSGFFIINLKNRRIYRNAKGIEDFDNHYCSMIVFRQDRDQLTYIGATCGRDDRLYVECQAMVKGTYYIAVSFPHKADAFMNKIEDIRKQETFSEEGLTYRVGVYSPFDKLQVDTVPEKDYALLTNFLDKIVHQMAVKNDNIYHFSDEGEPNSWRAISFEKEAGTFGYIFYENNSDGFINEHLTFTQFYNINLIPILGHGDIKKLDTENEEGIEEEKTREAIDILKNQVKLKSKVKVINGVKGNEEVTEQNPIELIIKVAPKSQCFILVEKTDEDAGIELNSRISITYPTYVLLGEKKFPAKKTRVKYNNKPTEIYECVIEHNSGVLFKYKNKTKDLKIAAHITFPDMENLKLSLKSEDLIENTGEGNMLDVKIKGDDNYKSYDPSNTEFNIEDPAREIVITLEPGEIKFFELSSVDIFESFAYSCQMDYHINLARNQAKAKLGVKK
jgi:hypothetical protein